MATGGGDGDKPDNFNQDLEALLGQGFKELVLVDSSDSDEGDDVEAAAAGNDGSTVSTTSSEQAALGATAAVPAVASPIKVNVPLFDASKMGFNDKAWNDPPELLMSTSPGTAGSGPVRTTKLTERVAFPLDYNQQQANSPRTQNLDPNGPPPTTGFIKKAEKPAPKTPPEEPEEDKTE